MPSIFPHSGTRWARPPPAAPPNPGTWRDAPPTSRVSPSRKGTAALAQSAALASPFALCRGPKSAPFHQGFPATFQALSHSRKGNRNAFRLQRVALMYSLKRAARFLDRHEFSQMICVCSSPPLTHSSVRLAHLGQAPPPSWAPEARTTAFV